MQVNSIRVVLSIIHFLYRRGTFDQMVFLVKASLKIAFQVDFLKIAFHSNY